MPARAAEWQARSPPTRRLATLLTATLACFLISAPGVPTRTRPLAVWLALLLLVIARGLYIAANAPTLFGRLLAGAITLTFFTYAVVNMGMVSGILPVVGIPLPLISYGGTALVSICLGFGILMSISTHKRLIQT